MDAQLQARDIEPINWGEAPDVISTRVKTKVTTLADFGDSNPSLPQNSRRLCGELGLDSIQWLKQEHTNKLVKRDGSAGLVADAIWTDETNSAVAVLTADCLPVFFSNAQAERVAVAHAGWRGLAAGILQNTLTAFDAGDEIYAAFGPAICRSHYEVGQDVFQEFAEYTKFSDVFAPRPNSNRFELSLYHLASRILSANGVAPPAIPAWCTYRDTQLFPSYRRQPSNAKRIGNLIWLAAS